MIKRLQRKFVLIAMLSLVAVLTLVVGGINGINIYQINRKSSMLLNMLADNGGIFPKEMGRREDPAEEKGKQRDSEILFPDKKESSGEEKKYWFDYGMSEETPFETRYFTVTIFCDSNETEEMTADMSHVAAVTETEAKEWTAEYQEKGKQSGYHGRYQFLAAEQEDGSILYVYLDCRNNFQSIGNFALVSLLVAILCLALVFILVTVFSRRAVRPVMESMEKQKQFLTDAGHELKTPVAIISANTEVIEMCEGESEWTRSIRNQVGRLTELINSLLMLAKMDETGIQTQMTDFCVNPIVEETIKNFSVVLDSKNQKIYTELDENLHIHGDEKSIRQLCTLLLDNAVKYTPKGGEIRIELERKDRCAVMRFYNDCEEIISQDDMSRLFDRFYRTDQSRSRQTGGYGIGLSVAKAIVQTHKGKIMAKAEKNGILFTVKIPLK
ncbi:MAG: sensor histidine kinase [Blautia sp.]